MAKNENMLVVFDPTQETASSVERVKRICQNRGKESNTSVGLLAIGGLSGQKSPPASWRPLTWLSDLQAEFEKVGANCRTFISWNPEWHEDVLALADAHSFDSITLPYRSGDKNIHLSDSFWQVIRQSKVRINMLGSTGVENRKVILVCRNESDPKLAEINQRSLDYAKQVAAENQAEVHVVCSYTDSLKYPDRSNLLRDTGLPNENLHIEHGDAPAAIKKVSDQFNADLLVLAVPKRTDLKTALMGRKLDKIIRAATKDMLFMV